MTKPITKREKDLRIAARAVSRGIAVGRAVCMYGHSRQFSRRTIAVERITQEVERVDAALEASGKQLLNLSRRIRSIAASAPGILDTHLLIVEEGSLAEKIKNEIRTHRVNAEWATKSVIDAYVGRYKELPDESIRERYIDIHDVGERMQVALGGTAEPFRGLVKGSVIVSAEMRPSTLIELADDGPVAVVTENGGWTSHTFIICRELALPAVTGASKLHNRIHDGDTVLVNGYTGEVVVNPSAATIRLHRESGHRSAVPSKRQPVGVPKTLDGRQICIRANADTPPAYARSRSAGAAGVGLFRSEYLYSRSKGFPTEKEQIEAYSAIADAAGEDGARIRTFDLHHDELVGNEFAREKNPALGLRAIRMSFAHLKELRRQLRALLIASHERRIDIVVPMIAGVDEMRSIAAILKTEKRKLVAKSISHGSPRLGAMIEVPSAVMTIDQIIAQVDFLALGTNDLVQYMLAVDRDNESVAGWFNSLHPGVLRAIKAVIDAATSAGKDLVICGEMAGSPFYVPLLVGLGARQLSMNVNSIAKVKTLISGIAYEEARAIANACLKGDTPQKVEQILREGIAAKWGPIFAEHFDSAPAN